MSSSSLVSSASDIRPATVGKINCDNFFYADARMGGVGGGGGGTTRPLLRDGGAEELRRDPTVGPHPKVWTIDQE